MISQNLHSQRQLIMWGESLESGRKSLPAVHLTGDCYQEYNETLEHLFSMQEAWDSMAGTSQ